MKVLLVWPNFEATNAAGVRGRAFASGLAKAGADVVVATPPDPGATRDVGPYRVETLPLSRNLADGWTEGRRALAAFGRREGPRLVVASSPSGLTLLQARDALADLAPFVADVRDLAADSLRATFGFKLRYVALRVAEARAYRASSAVLAVSGILRNALVEEYGVESARAHVVPNGANLDVFRGVRGAVKDVDVLFTGAMDDPGRRGDEMIDAFARVYRVRPKTRFRFLGWKPGKYADALERRMVAEGFRDAVDLVPPVPHAAMPGEIARGRVGVVPLQNAPVYRTAVGAKTYEYLAAGLPVAALGPTGDAELRRLLVGEECGIYASKADDFGDALFEILEDGETYARLALRAASVAEAYDRPRIVADAWENVLRPLAEARR